MFDLVRKTFLGFAEAHGLKWREEVHGKYGFSLYLEQQPGLQEKVWMTFDGIDEISCGIGDFFCGSVFPAPDALPEFTNLLSGIVSGEYRIKYQRCKSKLEAPSEKGWTTLAKYSGSTWHGFRT